MFRVLDLKQNTDLIKVIEGLYNVLIKIFHPTNAMSQKSTTIILFSRAFFFYFLNHVHWQKAKEKSK